MDRAYLLEVARRASGMTQAALAARSGTSQATLSAYERGLKSPTIKVAGRILEAAGYDLNLRKLIDWTEHEAPEFGRFWVPNILWNVEMPDCFATLVIPAGIDNGPLREWDMRNRHERMGAYEQMLRWSPPEDMIRWIDGPLLVDVWDELDLPDPIREAWKWPVRIARERTTPDPLRASESFTGLAWIRGREALPKKPPKPKGPRVRFIRTKFDPRPMPPQNPRPGPPAGTDGGR